MQFIPGASRKVIKGRPIVERASSSVKHKPSGPKALGFNDIQARRIAHILTELR